MATTQTQYVIPTGSFAPGTVLTAVPQAEPLSQEQMKAKEREQIVLLSRASSSFYIIGVAGILLSTADLTAGIFALINRSVLSYSCSWVWSGFTFGIINGSLALRAAKNKPQIDLHWTNVTFGFGITTILLHFVDLILAAIGVGVYKYTYSTDWYYGSEDTMLYYYYYSPVNAETTRLILLVLLVSLEIWQVALGGQLRRHFASKSVAPPVTYTVLTVTQTQQAPAPMNMQPQPQPQPQLQPHMLMQMQMQQQPMPVSTIMPSGYGMPVATMPPPSYQVSVNQSYVPMAPTPGIN